MEEKAENTRQLLVFQMKRAIELLEDKEFTSYSYLFPEFENKMHEVRRDSIRLIKELKPWRR